MFVIFLPAALLFRAENLTQSSELFVRIFSTPFDLTMANQLLQFELPTLLSLLLSLLVMNAYHHWSDFEAPEDTNPEAIMRRLVPAALLILMIATHWLTLLGTQEIAEFAYFQF